MTRQQRKTRQYQKKKGAKRNTQRKMRRKTQVNRRRKRRSRVKKGGGTHPLSEISQFPAIFTESLKGGVDTLFGNATPDTVHVSSLTTHQPYLDTKHNEITDIGPDLAYSYN